MTNHRIAGFSAAGPQPLCAWLDFGLHAALQPLTTLLAGFSYGYLAAMDYAHIKSFAAEAAAEVERLATLLHALQHLVALESIPPELTSTPWLPLLSHTIEGVSLLFEHQGVELHWQPLDAGPPLDLDRERTLEAFNLVLLAALGISRRNDIVEVTVQSLSASPGAVALRFQSAATIASALPTELALHLAVAEAGLRSQRGTCSWSLTPFCVDIQLGVHQRLS